MLLMLTLANVARCFLSHATAVTKLFPTQGSVTGSAAIPSLDKLK